MSATTAAIPAAGWELHCDSGTSDKFYRFIVIFGSNPGVIFIYGRRGDRGQVRVHPHDSAKTAIRRAVTMTHEKERKSYFLTCDFTPFSIPATELADMNDTTSVDAHGIAALFRQQAADLGNERPNVAPL
ncbi:WGR domain-containing protein [Streptomyces nanshensis]|uniref:WGR domain-containing protein n=1 Tax=Streptomyces nanshensis TaxID=518642 RepID=A0A1E7KZM0_9ACTN|nr:WGR domain-containing protein [Streptomyces nanshensis]OEV09253.1 hypothetical protein AN218_22615 [Streptomyces nanshensis]